MRIIAGAWRGRRLDAPPGTRTRPTAERARQALFDMITHAPWSHDTPPLDDIVVLDAFAGTGALGLEALSRGAARAVFMENDRAAVRKLAANLEHCGAGDRAQVLACDVLRPPRSSCPAAYVFLDAPYGQDLTARATEALRDAGWIVGGTIMVAETGRDEAVALAGEMLADRTYGVARFRIYRL